MADDTVAHLKNRSAKPAVVVQFDKTADIHALQSLPGVEALRQGNPRQYIITGANTDALRRQLVQFSLDNTLNIETLSVESQSLETVFAGLTREKG